MSLHTIKVDNPHAHNLVVGESNVSGTIDNISAALLDTVPGVKFGLAFSSTNLPGAVKSSGTDDNLIHLAMKSAVSLGARKTFVLLLDASQPASIMQVLNEVPEIREIYCATQSGAEFIVSENSQGRGVMGLADTYSHGDNARIHYVNKDAS